MAEMTNVAPRKARGSDALATAGIFVPAFVAFLAIALFAQLLGWQWRAWLPGAEGEKSLIHGVKSAVYTFMSYT